MKMSKPPLAEHLANLRRLSKLSVAEVAKKAGDLSPHAVWKAERGGSIKAETLATILRRGYGLTETDPAYVAAFAHWAAGRGKVAGPAIGAAWAVIEDEQDRQLQAFANQVIALLMNLPPEDRPAVLEALRHVPQLKLWLASRG
jgi:transcriptional regulator with XRE-family HTH domain